MRITEQNERDERHQLTPIEGNNVVRMDSSREDETVVRLPVCENGVCSLNWRPRRPEQSAA